ncbi:DUF2271 domain-containing protein [Nannocystaceae bacterium ST9]
MLASALACACSEGGLQIAEPLVDEGEATTASDTGLATEGAELDGLPDEGPLDEGPLDEGPLDEGESGGESSVFVAPGQTWRFMTGASIPSDWTSPEFDDRGWSSGAGPLGHGLPVTTQVATAPDLVTAWFRASFEISDPSTILGLDLRLRRDDGAIAYLNGTEVLRTNLPTGAIGPTTRAVGEARYLDQYYYLRAFPDAALLRAGTNVLAVEIHDRSTAPEDRVIDALLQAVDPSLPPDELEVRVRTIGYAGKYGPRNVGAIWIERGDGSFVRTLEVWGDVRREHLIAWRTASDENDLDAVTSSTATVHATRVATWDLLDLAGQPVPAGLYRVRVEFTEDDSNEGAPAGPTIAVDFELDAAPDRIEAPSSGDANAFADLLLWSP